MFTCVRPLMLFQNMCEEGAEGAELTLAAQATMEVNLCGVFGWVGLATGRAEQVHGAHS